MSYPGAPLPDESTFTEGTSPVTPIGGEYNDSATAPSAGQAAAVRITPNRAIHTNLRNQSGTEIGTSSAPVRVDPTGTTTQPVSVSGTIPVSGTFWQSTQPVSGTVSVNALPAGTNTIGNVELVDSAGTNKASISAGGALKVDGSAAPQPVTGTFWQSTQPVSGSVTGNQGTANTVGNAWPVKVTDGTSAVTVASLTNSKALAVEIVDGAGSQITSFGGGTQYADGTTQSTPTGTVALGKNPSNLLHAVSLDSSGNLNVNVAAGGASGGTSSSYGSAFPATGTAIGASDGTNMQALQVESSSNKNLRVGLYSGANEASVASGDSTQNTLLVAGARKESSFTTTTAQAVASTDVSNYSFVSVHITSQGTGSSILFQISNDNSNWTSLPLFLASSTGGSLPVTTTSAASTMYAGPIMGRYFRLNVVGITAGTTAGVVEFFSSSRPSIVGANYVTQSTTVLSNTGFVNGQVVATAATGIQKVGLADGTGNAIGSTSGALNVNIASGGGSGFSVADETAWTAGTTSMVPAGAVFNDTATALTSGQEGTLRSTNNRALHVNLRNASATEIGTSSNPIQVSLANTGSNGTAVAVSAASLPLPSGAATAAKQPALGTAGTASSDVITVQGIASMTALKVDGTGGTFNVGQNGTWTVQPGNTANTTPWLVSLSPGTSGGWSVNSQTALTNSVVTIKSSGGNFGGYMFYNPNSSVTYIQVFDGASTLGTTTPTYVIPLPATSGANLNIPSGITHATSIKAAATTTPTGSTAPTTSLTGFFLFN